MTKVNYNYQSNDDDLVKRKNQFESMDFKSKLENRMSKPLPGVSAQNIMKAKMSTGEAISFTHEGPPRQGGVALLLYQEHGSWYFPLMKRPVYGGIHSGQISLPGGKLESSDQNLVDTALRETREELGLTIFNRQVIGSLTELYIVASHFNILPVVAVLDAKPVIAADEREVQQVIIASVDELLLPHSSKEKKMLVRGHHLFAPYFEVENEVVWGATAMILNEFITIVREI